MRNKPPEATQPSELHKDSFLSCFLTAHDMFFFFLSLLQLPHFLSALHCGRLLCVNSTLMESTLFSMHPACLRYALFCQFSSVNVLPTCHGSMSEGQQREELRGCMKRMSIITTEKEKIKRRKAKRGAAGVYVVIEAYKDRASGPFTFCC